MTVAERSRTADATYDIRPEVEAELVRDHPGKWAALNSEGELLAVDESSVVAYRKAQKLGTQVPTLYHVPEPGTRSFYY